MTATSFEQLCAELEGKIEDRSFDMKRDPPTVRDVAKEIQAGINGIEPSYRLIIGIDEGPQQKFQRANVNPIVWPIASGAFSDPDAYRLAIDASLRSTTSDYHEGLWKFDVIDVPGGDILVVEAFQSPYRPHQNTQTERYYIRRSGNTSSMTPAELRQAFAQISERPVDPESPRPQLEAGTYLADLRQHDWVPDADELRYAGGPQFHLRVAPLNPTEGKFTGTQLKNSIRGLHALGPWTNGSHERVEDGFLAWRVESKDLEVTGSFSKAFGTGEIWGVDNSTVSPTGDGTANIPAMIIGKTKQKIVEYGNVLESLAELPPYRVQVALHGVRGAPLHTSDRGNDGHCLQDTFVFNAIWERDKDVAADALVLELAEALWDACGLVFRSN